jgi:hypothetical protein
MRQAVLFLLLCGLLSAAPGPLMTVYKTPTCGCCAKWVEHMKQAGFRVVVKEVPTTAQARKDAGIPEKYGSCHTGIVNGYAIEGHVPAADVQRLLKLKPKAVGLAVPGMPMGSPGMEGPYKDAYRVLLVTADGVETFQQYAGSR